MKRKEIITSIITTLAIGAASILFICRDIFFIWITKKGYNIETIFTNIILLATIIILATFNFLIISNKKNQKDQIVINNLQADIEDINKSISNTIANSKKTLSEKIINLNKLISMKQKMIKELNLKIEEVSKECDKRNKDIDNIAQGVQNLYYILSNEIELDMDKQQTCNFISCYKLIDSSFVDKLETAEKGSITPKEELFCIMHRLNKSPEEIRLILNLSKVAYRQLKFRALKRISNENNLKEFRYKIQNTRDTFTS